MIAGSAIVGGTAGKCGGMECDEAPLSSRKPGSISPRF